MVKKENKKSQETLKEARKIVEASPQVIRAIGEQTPQGKAQKILTSKTAKLLIIGGSVVGVIIGGFLLYKNRDKLGSLPLLSPLESLSSIPSTMSQLLSPLSEITTLPSQLATEVVKTSTSLSETISGSLSSSLGQVTTQVSKIPNPFSQLQKVLKLPSTPLKISSSRPRKIKNTRKFSTGRSIPTPEQQVTSILKGISSPFKRAKAMTDLLRLRGL